MKIKNLLLVPLLSAALVATSCSPSNGGSSSSEPTSGETQKAVSRVTVKAVSSAVVGDVLDFDTLVDVYYDDGSTSKDYTLEVPAASKDLVKVEGKKVELLKEGSVSILVKAGGEQAKFTTTVFSKLKAHYANDTKSLSDTWALLSVDSSENFYVATVHRPDYTYVQRWDDDTGDAGGFLKAQNGNTYSYTLGSDLEVESTVYGEFSGYLVNYPYQLDSAYFATKTIGEGSEAYEALVMDKDTAGSWADSRFPTQADQFMLTNGLSLNSSYRFGDVIISEVEIEVAADVEITTYEIEVQVLAVADESYAGSYYYFMDNDLERTEVTPVRDYIDSGDSPAGKDKTPIVNTLASAYAAKNFTIDIDLFSNTYDDEGELIPGDSSQWYDETIYANETMYQDALYFTDDGSLGAGKGFVEHEGSLYSYTYDEDTNPATLIGEGGKIYVDAIASTLAVLGTEAVTDSLFVSEIKDTTSGSKVYYLPITTNLDFILKFVNLYSGTPIRNWRSYAATNYGIEILSDSFTTAYFEISTSAVVFNLEVFSGMDESGHETYYEMRADIKDIGTTAAIPTEVKYPD